MLSMEILGMSSTITENKNSISGGKRKLTKAEEILTTLNFQKNMQIEAERVKE
jgi:hypothetical protein